MKSSKLTLNFVWGCNAYSDVREPRVGEILVLRRESNNLVVVAVVKVGVFKAHILRKLFH